MATSDPVIFKIVPRALWLEAQARGVFHGAPVDFADGYIHLSTATQVVETARRHFAGQADLLLVAVSAERLGADLRYEVSRGGALFPHLYRPLELADALWIKDLPLGPDGAHVFPPLGDGA